jgi:phage terminase large subunit-like protein
VFYDDETGKYIIYPHLFTPKDTLIEREEIDKNPYSRWVKQGDLIALEGKYVNFESLLDYVNDLDSNFKFEQIGFDRWGSSTILNRLEDKWDIIPLGQGSATMTAVINDFENLLIDERLIIADNEVFNFMAKNVVAVVNDAGIRYSKTKSEFKIDGIIAMLMGLLLAVEANGLGHYDALEQLGKMDW